MPQEQNSENNSNPSNSNQTEGQTTQTEETSQNTDDFGYETEGSGETENKQNEAEGTPTGYDKPPEKKEETENKEDETNKEANKTGYGEKPPEKKEEPKEEPETEEDDSPLELLDTSQFTQEEVKAMKAHIKEQGMDAKQAKKFIGYEKQRSEMLSKMVQEQKKEAEQREIEQKQAWHKELKEDPEFGGENFGKNVKQVDRVIEDHLPNLKKQLTETGAMLPPYVMRDLHNLAKTLYKTENVVTGSPQSTGSDDEDDHLAFYD